jgi:hypothetical protein
VDFLLSDFFSFLMINKTNPLKFKVSAFYTDVFSLFEVYMEVILVDFNISWQE